MFVFDHNFTTLTAKSAIRYHNPHGEQDITCGALVATAKGI
jgi:hypothetical protein